MAEKARAGRNGIDPEKLKAYVGRLENKDGDLAKLKSDHMLACKDVHADKKQILKDAKAEGISPKALKVVVKQRKLERAAKEAAIGLDIDDLSQHEQIRHALGDYVETPLGAAAVAAAGNGAHASA